jgi:hypothetical protein
VAVAVTATAAFAAPASGSALLEIAATASVAVADPASGSAPAVVATTATAALAVPASGTAAVDVALIGAGPPPWSATSRLMGYFSNQCMV